MDKISVNVTDFVYGSKCNACNSVYAISLSNRVVFLEGAQETKNGRNQGMIPTFFCVRPDHYLLSATTGKSPHTNLSKSPLCKGVAHSKDCRNDSAEPAEIRIWNPHHSTIATVRNRGAMFSSFVFLFVYDKKVPFSYTNHLVIIFNSIKYNQQSQNTYDTFLFTATSQRW